MPSTPINQGPWILKMRGRDGWQGPGRREKKKWPKETRGCVRTKKVLHDLLQGPLMIMTQIGEGP